jgi:hypothetical protein
MVRYFESIHSYDMRSRHSHPRHVLIQKEMDSNSVLFQLT